MPTQSPFAELNLFGRITDKPERFIDFRDLIAGPDDTSNFMKIDTLLSTQNTSINSLNTDTIKSIKLNGVEQLKTANSVNLAVIPLSGSTEVGGQITPSTNNAYTLGNASRKWYNIYATTFTGSMSGTLTIGGLGTSNIGTYNGSSSKTILLTPTNIGAIPIAGSTNIAGSLTPVTNNSINLGSTTRVWANIYATNFIGTVDGGSY